jgi:hypothetical protein
MKALPKSAIRFESATAAVQAVRQSVSQPDSARLDPDRSMFVFEKRAIQRPD